MRFARKRDTKKVARLFREIDEKLDPREIKDLIREKKVVVFHRRKKIAGAFSFALLGIAGILSMLYVRKLAVDRSLRGKGVGSLLLRKIKGFSIRRKALGFFLWSLARSKKFYQKNKLRGIGRVFWWWK